MLWLEYTMTAILSLRFIISWIQRTIDDFNAVSYTKNITFWIKPPAPLIHYSIHIKNITKVVRLSNRIKTIYNNSPFAFKVVVQLHFDYDTSNKQPHKKKKTHSTKKPKNNIHFFSTCHRE